MVTQVIHHVFTGDLDKKKNFAKDEIDTSRNDQALHSAICGDCLVLINP